jgi:nitrite reductase/ring-hydroxylating ferredoxin subunit/DMSO/TMAO reductase YedYZ heme-binding membrane subunit
VFLNLVLLIGPWSRFSDAVRRIYRHRRHLGVTSYFLAQMHFSLVFSNYFQNSFANAFMALFTFFGFTAYFIMLALALTSWDWMQKHVSNKQWKRIHLGVFVAYFAIAAYAFWVNLSNNLPIEPWQWTAVVSFLILWYLMAPWGLAPKLISNLMGWKQLHTLIHIGYLSVVLHAWFGVVVAQPLWLKLTFWSLVVFTWGSHAVGWLIKWKEDRALKTAAAQSKQIMVDGKAYWSLGRAEEWEEGKAKKFLVQNLPVAVFRYREKFFGLYAICAHQKGPIEKGKIVNGYVECPWHGWQYSCETGLGPPGFTDKLSFFPCVVQEGVVFVSAQPRRPVSAATA